MFVFNQKQYQTAIIMKTFYPSLVWKHCPYCGSQHINWTNHTHRMQCNACQRTFYINASAAVVALIKNNNNELLFTQRKNNPAQGMLDLPGGFVDLNETAEDAIKREVLEELNVTVTELQFFGTFPNQYLYDGIVYFTLDLVFVCHVEDFTSLRAADDVCDYHFINPQHVVLNDIGFDSIRAIVQKIKQ